IVQTLMKHLNSRQFAMFRETCFGYFLDLPIVGMQPRLIHSLLLREVVHHNGDELWHSLNGCKIHFGISEFALVTGLKCTGVAHKRYDDNKSCGLIDRCFQGIKKLNSQAIIDCFEGKRWSSDHDAVKIAVLYFIHSFLFLSLPDSPVSIGHFELVESGEFENYPWGKLVFNDTYSSLRKAFRGKRSKKYSRLYGFPLSFQIWFYECCPRAKDQIAVYVQ
ncbi:hypothetical protein A4A49_65698, partial [Nicotiana attenuata]